MLLFLLACDPFPEADPVGVTRATTPDTRAVTSSDHAECDPNILVPTGILAAEASVPAEPHAEVYGGAPLPFHVHLGIPSRDPSTTMSMLWRTDVSTLASVVEIGPSASWPVTAVKYAGASFLFGSGVVGAGDYRVHEVRLCERLTPATTYSYRVGGESGWSEVYEFTTAPVRGSNSSFRVVFLGDSRSDMETWALVAAAVQAEAPDLLVFSGDMVATGSDQSHWDAWYAASGDLFARVPMVAAHGNHEFLAQNYFAQLGLPGNEEWFAVDWADALFLTLNDTVRDASEVEVTQRAFLEAELSAATARWKISNHHQPIYTVNGSHDSREDLRDLWATVWESYGLDLDIAGHNHVYERSVPIRGGVEDPDGTTYIVSGGAGAPLYTRLESYWYGLVANPVYHYVVADFGPTSLDIVARDLSGNVIDSFSLPR